MTSSFWNKYSVGTLAAESARTTVGRDWHSINVSARPTRAVTASARHMDRIGAPRAAAPPRACGCSTLSHRTRPRPTCCAPSPTCARRTLRRTRRGGAEPVKAARPCRAKFGAVRLGMLFTEAGLEQATRLSVAAQHAGRFQRAGLRWVADLGCGIGARRPRHRRAGARGHGGRARRGDRRARRLQPRAVVERARSSTAPPRMPTSPASTASTSTLPAGRAAGASPTRRTGPPPSTSPSTSPSDSRSGVKLAPGIDRGLIPAHAEAQWVSVDHDVVEVGLWFGALARPGIRRAALVVNTAAGGASELTAEADSEDAEVRPLGAYLFEPDGAVIRARLIGDLARSLGAGMLDPTIAYLTADEAAQTPVRELLPRARGLPARQAAPEARAGGAGHRHGRDQEARGRHRPRRSSARR